MKKWAILIVAAIWLSGCQNDKGQPPTSIPEQTQQAQQTNDKQPDQTNNHSQTASKDGKPESSEGTEKTDTSPDSGSSPSDSATEQTGKSDEKQQNEQISKKYHMTKAYNIVPNDEKGNNKVVLLTFDDGPKDKDMIESLIETLDKHKAKAIFFVNGYRVKAHPELLKYIHEKGQIIGNHSWDHIVLKKESNEKILQQVQDVQKIVKETIGEAPLFFRPPNGASNDFLKETVKKEGMLFMTWSNGSLDWADNQKKPDGIIKSVLEQLHPGSNILMHELPWTVEALDSLLTKLEEKGYSFVDPREIELEMR